MVQDCGGLTTNQFSDSNLGKKLKIIYAESQDLEWQSELSIVILKIKKSSLTLAFILQNWMILGCQ